jgi:hypothetical protein
MFQVKSKTSSDRVLSSAFRMSQGALWTRSTFATMLQTLPGISFDAIVKDALYVMPRDTNVGFTERELGQERMKYLRTLG